MPTVKRFEDLECWQEARKLVGCVYELTNKSSFKKDFELAGQIKRSSVSVMANSETELQNAKQQSEFVWKKINDFISYLNQRTK